MALQRWRRVARIAKTQYGVIDCKQLIDAGFTRHMIAGAVARGHLIPLHRGVYAVGHLPVDVRGHRVAATLAVVGASVSNRSGAEHFRVLAIRRGPIHVTLPSRNGRARRAGLRVHRAKLQRDERTEVEGVRCTTISRVLLDLAGERPGELEQAIKAAGDRELLKVRSCLRLLDRYPSRPGAPLLRRLLVGEEPVPEFTRSGLERRMFRLCRTAGLPLPQMNVDIPTDGEIYECDCVWPEYRLIIECDSKWHDNPLSATEDALKDQALTLTGSRVHRLRWAQIVLEPERAARTVRHLQTEQARLLGRAAP